jgi:dCTP deaminase
MSILSDHEIQSLCESNEPMITPFTNKQMGDPSFGLSSYGYDIRLGSNFKMYPPRLRVDPNDVIDPRNFRPELAVDIEEHGAVVISSGGFALAESVEVFDIPRDILVVCVGKSTYARCGLIVNVTPLEPEWKGKLTLELSNTTPLPVKVYPGHGIAQLLFFRADEPCWASYADRKGRYQNQPGVTGPKARN